MIVLHFGWVSLRLFGLYLFAITADTLGDLLVRKGHTDAGVRCWNRSLKAVRKGTALIDAFERKHSLSKR